MRKETMSFETVNRPRIDKRAHSIPAGKLHTPVLPQLPERFRRWVNAAYAAHGGAESMKLSDWRDLELQLKRRMEKENHEHQR